MSVHLYDGLYAAAPPNPPGFPFTKWCKPFEVHYPLPSQLQRAVEIVAEVLDVATMPQVERALFEVAPDLARHAGRLLTCEVEIVGDYVRASVVFRRGARVSIDVIRPDKSVGLGENQEAWLSRVMLASEDLRRLVVEVMRSRHGLTL